MVRVATLALSVLAAWFLPDARAGAECLPAPDLAAYQNAAPTDFVVSSLRNDRIGRVVAPVDVNGRGPFRFIVDTGANRSVLSTRLAQALGLEVQGEAEVHSVHGVVVAPLARVDTLTHRGVSVGGAPMPLLGGDFLAGEDGLLGVDGMRDRRLRLDFERNCIEISPANGRLRSAGWRTVQGELRFGHLIVIRGVVEGVVVNMLLDTGSDATLANSALREALSARVRVFSEAVVAETAGSPVELANYVRIRRLRFGGIQVQNLSALVGDFHIFNVWGLQAQPTVLVGMDVLSQAREVAIDYRRGLVQFKLREDLSIDLQTLPATRLPSQSSR